MTMSAYSASALATPSRPRSSWRRMLHPLWYGRSVRAQLLLVLVLIDLIAVLLAGSVTVLRARAQTRVEVAASTRLAEFLVSEAVNLVHQELPAEQFLALLPTQLRSIRHVRIAVTDAAGVPIALPADAGRIGDRPAEARAPAPAWFTALVAPPVETHDVPVIVDGHSIGQVAISGEPADEIAEIWENAVAIGTVGFLLNVAMICVLYVLFGRVLDPLTGLATGLSDLEHRTYSVRLKRPHTRELGAIAEHFNALALALERLSAENQELNRRLITAQDDERRRTALELHDEVGPCLFGLKANASSIASAAGELPEQARLSVSARLRDILAVIEHLQAINRSMLDRLRPMALGHVPLKEMLDQLVRDRARQHPEISFEFAAGDILRSYGDTVDLTIYRCMQESLTNAIRHARPKHVTIALVHGGPEAQLELTVRDDGCGMRPGTPPGFGMRGMQERVEGLGGGFSVESEPDRGTCVRVIIAAIGQQEAAAAAQTNGRRA
jgi:two-component system, NarL family, sensor histidine kinase UhpB